jgi:DNA-directed RNA polymerase specialized sigma24 family protein
MHSTVVLETLAGIQRRAVGEPDLEDAASDVAVRILARTEEPDHPAAYLWCAVRNRRVDLAREAVRCTTMSLEDIVLATDDGTERGRTVVAPLEVLLAQEEMSMSARLLSLVHECLLELPRVGQVYVRRTLFNGEHVSEVADSLGHNRSTGRSILHRCRQRLFRLVLERIMYGDPSLRNYFLPASHTSRAEKPKTRAPTPGTGDQR